MKRFILVHGWEGGPHKNWFPWLASELKTRGYAVVAPQLPRPAEPRKEHWVPALASAVGTPDEETYFIAHSIGVQTTLRYLESLPVGVSVGGAVFVAGFVRPLVNLEDAEAEEVAASWTGAPLDLAKVRTHVSKSIALFSDDDPWVSLDNADAFREQIGSEIVTEHARGHFIEAEEPAILAAALRLVS